MQPYHITEYWDLYKKKFGQSKFIVDEIAFIMDQRKNVISLPGLCNVIYSFDQLVRLIDKYNILAMYLLSRTSKLLDYLPEEYHNRLQTNEGLFQFSKRNFVEIDLDLIRQNKSEWLARLRKDTLRSYKKLQKNSMVNVHENLLETDLKLFHTMYMDNHNYKKMNYFVSFELYHLNYLLSNSSWKLLKVTQGDITVGFILISFFEDTVDQFALAYNRSQRDSSRITILACIEHLLQKDGYKFYNLGGGIQEDDDLFKYKISFGAYVKTGLIVKFCSQNHHLFRKDLDISLERWPSDFG